MVAIIYQLDALPILLISGRYQFLKAQELEVNLKVLDEVRLSCIVAVAVYYFVLEVLFIMA